MDPLIFRTNFSGSFDNILDKESDLDIENIHGMQSSVLFESNTD